MPAAKQKKRTWAGLVCPVCRFVFRVPKDHDGVGVICPACHYLLNIPNSKKQDRHVASGPVGVEGTAQPLIPAPRTGDRKESKPIVSRPLSEKDSLPASPLPSAQPAGSTAPPVAARPSRTTSSSSGRKRVRRKKPGSQVSPDWENKSSSSSSGSGNPLVWVVGGSLLGLSVVGVGAWLVIDSINNTDKSDDSTASSPSVGFIEPILVKEDQMTDEEKRKQKEIKDSVQTGMSVLTDAEGVVRKFLTAETVDDLESVVRAPNVTMPRIREWYEDTGWTPPGVKDIGYGGRITVKGKMASMDVRLNDYSIRHVALEYTSDGYKVDWESWVAWSSIKWEELFKQLPAEPVEVRVHCSLDSYYNRLFSDDTKWVAVRLEHPLYDRTIYGYIDKESPALMRFVTDLQGSARSVATIKIKYPENAIAKNQVYITEYVRSGWVRPSDDTADDETSTD